MEVLFGSDNKLSCKTYNNLKFPKKGEPLRTHLKEILVKIGKYDEVAQIDDFLLSRIIKNRLWPEDICVMLENFSTEEQAHRIYIGKKF